MVRARVLLTEGSSLTAREHVTVLGRAGVEVEVMSPDPWALCRWSRWVRRMHPCPTAGGDPMGYLGEVAGVLAARPFDALLPTHEQAWLLAERRDLLPAGTPVALADPAAFARVQGKRAFAALLDDLGLPQPAWRPVTRAADLDGLAYPYFLKAEYGTAGRGVRLVGDDAGRADALRHLWGAPDGGPGAPADGVRDAAPLLAQQPAVGQYGQVQALFDRGRMVAAHTSVQRGIGLGGSAAARESVDHPVARAAAAAVGGALAWHGGLTLDYLHRDGQPQLIECNPRTVEPANAAAPGVDLPLLSIDLAAGRPLPPATVTGRPGVRTHGTLALVLGAADGPYPRRRVAAALGQAAARTGRLAGSAEVLTPLLHDPPSLMPLGLVTVVGLARPAMATRLAGTAVGRYATPPPQCEL